MDKLYAGARLRRLREERGLSQVELARILAISASYLNQIEHDTRPLTVTVLVRLTEVFGVDPAFFSPRDTARQLAELRESLPEAGGATGLPLSDLQQVAGSMPEVAEAIVQLHRRYRDAVAALEALTDRRTAAQALMPHEHVRDFFYRHQNYIDPVDRAAEDLARSIGTRRLEVRHHLRRHLQSAHGVTVATTEPDGRSTLEYDETTRTLRLAPDLRPGQQAFRMATQLAYLEAADVLDTVLDAETWPDDTTRALARIGLAHYFAGALILPYRPFFRAAERLRYDVEVLAEHFGVGYETAAHRLSTLQRAELRGVPFIFVRVDKAGNISKRVSATGFHFSRSGGTCPLWNVYDAFASPGQVDVQVAEMPDGQRYLWTARTVTRRRGGYGSAAKTFVIGLGCELRQAGRLVYSAGLDLAEPDVMPIGPGCRTCDRPRCPQRAAPPIGRPLQVDERRSSFDPYGVGRPV
ncbi:short-chain fatty acyl-CoA regulator family protein [Aeromicrobium sp. CnD17-E]|uniref:short-chain fatty acyl-CoA regulator family protein n=1 Tax=Aeromicrobium sp. CnD17-E TaxID=2954487 RepID=UPI00209840C7|nr:short-chain fatty acyl-CoA regulator family protein [Aeromicrobium sp. CnD17-E]MCO7240091.1 short-chain fatty acyl-CoA regulator family protein [Aeromicrobium sp. CnD17-E]